jgi:hypothetical protein
MTAFPSIELVNTITCYGGTEHTEGFYNLLMHMRYH